jgi:hypothetical protein
MGTIRVLSVALMGVVAFAVLPAGAKLRCGKPSKCSDPAIVADVRAAAAEACPCEAATSRKAYAKCWKPVVKGRARSLGKAAFPKACRAGVTRALANATCGRPDTVLCRKVNRKGVETCRVTPEAKCGDPYERGVFSSCADTCDEIEAVPFPTTTELSPTDLASLAPVADDGVLHFETAPAALDDVAVGSILVAGVGPSTPAGLLRAVLAVERDGERLTLVTGQAPIQLAYRKLHVRFVRSMAVPDPAAASRGTRTGPHPQAITASQPFDFVLFDGDGDVGTTNDQIVIEGTIGGGFDFDFALDVDWGNIDSLPDLVTTCLASFVDVLTGGEPMCDIDSLLPEAKVTFVVHPEVEADANVRGAAILEYEKELDLASQTLTPIVVGPLVFVPVADVTALLAGGASGAFSTGIHGSAVFETSVTVSTKQTQTPQFKEPVLKSTDFGPNDTSVTLHARAKVGIGARLNLLLFGVTGPYATARAYGALEADVLDAPCWSLHAGLEADLGVRVTSPALPFIGQVTLVDWRAPTLNPLDVEVTTGDCDAPPEQSTLPPGSGPDAVRLANPTYTPWSRTFAPPVEGVLAGSPGNGVVFSDLQRTIDGHYLRSGFGVVTLTKVDDAGGLVWARNLRFDDQPLRPLRVRSGSDGGLLAVSRTVTAPILLTRLAQDGTVVDARAWDVPLETCNVEVTALASDGAGGAWVTGSCIGTPPSFLLHAGTQGGRFWLLGDVPTFRLNVAERLEDGVFLAGHVSDGGDPLVAARLRRDGTVQWSKRYDGCVEAPDAIPSAAIVGALGEVTIAGSGGAQHNGILVRLRPDGSVGFAAFPGFGFGAGSVFLLDSLVELPTTGYVAGGSAVQFTGSEPADVPSAALVGFDAAGQILWANRYTFGGPGMHVPAGHVGVRLSDDGGVVATALAVDALDVLGGLLWTMKPFARDGTIPFVPGGATLTPLGVVNLGCSLNASDRPLVLQETSIPTRAVSVTSSPAALTTEQQTPN